MWAHIIAHLLRQLHFGVYRAFEIESIITVDTLYHQSKCELIIILEMHCAEIVVENDFFFHDTPNEFILRSPPTNTRDSLVPYPASTASTVFFATLAMSCVRAIEFVPLHCHVKDCGLHIAPCRNLNKTILQHRCVTIRPACSVFSVRAAFLSLLGDVLYLDSLQVFSLA